MNRLNTWRYFALLIIIVSLALQWYAHECGILLIGDSFNHLAAAQSFRHSFEFLNANGSHYVYWPPLFPIILSFFEAPLIVMQWINLFMVAIIGLLLADFAQKTIQHNSLRLIYLISSLCGVHLMMDAVFLWSELIFITLSISFLYHFQKVHDSKSSITYAMLFGLLMCLQRNAGLYIVVGVLLWYLCTNNTTDWKVTIKKVVLFFFITSSGFLLWNLSNYFLLDSGFKIKEDEFFLHIRHNLNSMSRALISAYLPVRLWSIPLMIIFFFIIGFILKRDILKNRTLLLMGFVTLSYLAGMVTLFAINYDEEDRYISAILPFFGLILFSSLDKILTHQSKNIKIISVLLLILWLGYPVTRTIKNVSHWHKVSCSR